MSILKRLWSQIVRFAKALEGIDDAAGDYMFSLGKRGLDLRHMRQAVAFGPAICEAPRILAHHRRRTNRDLQHARDVP